MDQFDGFRAECVPDQLAVAAGRSASSLMSLFIPNICGLTASSRRAVVWA
ncbi:hypothetical protein [Sulfuriferula plumbiphila]|nr:hypothetical protein [Sulfuriferula plumbiphila]